MIAKISALINKRLSDLGLEEQSTNQIIKNSKLSFSDNLDKGHLTTNIAMVGAGVAKKNPKEIAEFIKKSLLEDQSINKIEIAGPGFINIFLEQEIFLDLLCECVQFSNQVPEKEKQKIQVEFVSANPTGPLHVGHGRGAAYGDAIIRLLNFKGHDATGEYYVNDAGRQIDILTCSIILRGKNLFNDDDFPESAYKAEYINDIAAKINPEFFENFSIDELGQSPNDPEKQIDDLIAVFKKESPDLWAESREIGLAYVIESIKDDLQKFNVIHEHWFYESSLGNIEDKESLLGKAIETVKENNGYEKDGALWLQSTNHGDDKDRVLVREDGRGTYLASDVAYHKNKLDRNFDVIVNVWGSDHHGYIKRIESSIESMGYSKERLRVQLVQFANLFENGKKVKMSTRSGEFYKLSDLIEKLGTDVSRFYYLSKQADQHLDFDLSLATEENKENIYFYIQYAHARISSLEQKYLLSNDDLPSELISSKFSLCDKLILKSLKFDEIIDSAVENLQPHLIIFYLKDLAHQFHQFYNDHNILKSDAKTQNDIMFVLSNVKKIFSKSLELLGISAMDKM